MRWAVGLTTVPGRAATTLPRTLRSLAWAGFPSPHLFIDKCREEDWRGPGNRRTFHEDWIGIFGNWWLGAWELFIRNPKSDRYVMCQDDVVFCRNVCRYLEMSPYPESGYQNLILYPDNAIYANEGEWSRVGGRRGLGAQCLVFSHDAFFKLLTSEYLGSKPTWQNRHDGIDGAISDAMLHAGWFECVHSPSLVCHIPGESAAKNRMQPETANFPGVEFDAMSLLNREKI